MHRNAQFQRIRGWQGRCVRCLALLSMALLWARFAIAAPPAHVLVLPGSPGEAAAASLAEALRIQLGVQGSVSVGDALTGPTLSAKLDEATAVLARMDASLAFWVEQDPASEQTDILLFAVLREGGRSLVATLHAPPEDRAAIERMLAMKAVEILRGSGMMPAPPPAPSCPSPVVPPPPCLAPVAVPPPTRYRTWMASLGLWGALPTAGTGIREGLVGGLGQRLVMSAWAIEAFAGGRLVSTAVIDDSGAQLTVGESDLVAGTRVLRAWARFALGAGVQTEGWILRAAASGPDASGTNWHLVPALSGELDARVRLSASVEVQMAGGAAFPLRETRFWVGSREFLDYGHVRPMANLSLVFSLR
jgi:hypothetical protein